VQLVVGYSHPCPITRGRASRITGDENVNVKIGGIDKELRGQVAGCPLSAQIQANSR